MELSRLEIDQLTFMKNIVKSFINTPYVLKGGTALLLGHSLDRFSEDLDFDSTKKLNIEAKIKECLPKSFKITNINKPKDTDTVQRYKILYTTPNGEAGLKIETSFREKIIDASKIKLIDNMKIYSIESLLDKKLLAAHDGEKPRTTARDLYDINFIIKNHQNILGTAFEIRLKEFAFDKEKIYDRYLDAYNEDPLINTRVTLDELVESLFYHIESIGLSAARDIEEVFADSERVEAAKKVKGQGL